MVSEHLERNEIWKQVTVFLFAAGVHLCPRRPSRMPNRQCLLGAVLLGAWDSAGRTDAVRQDHRRGRRQLQHLLLRDGGWKTRPEGRLRGSGAHRCRYVGTAHHVYLRAFTEGQLFNFRVSGG